MRDRRTFNESASEKVKETFKKTFKYNPITGEITRKKKEDDRLYTRLSKKGYIESVYLVVDKVEYRATYHRLCWFLHHGEVVPDNMQIDHKNNIKVHNWIDNLQICLNADNKKKTGLYKNNTTGYKGVHPEKEVKSYGTYEYYIAAIRIDNYPVRVARFKDIRIAAAFYDAATRYYYKEFSLPNMEEVYIEPCDVYQLRVLKKDKEFMRKLTEKLYGKEEMDAN